MDRRNFFGSMGAAGLMVATAEGAVVVEDHRLPKRVEEWYLADSPHEVEVARQAIEASLDRSWGKAVGCKVISELNFRRGLVARELTQRLLRICTGKLVMDAYDFGRPPGPPPKPFTIPFQTMPINYAPPIEDIKADAVSPPARLASHLPLMLRDLAHAAREQKASYAMAPKLCLTLRSPAIECWLFTHIIENRT